MKKILKSGNGPISSLVAKCECGCVFEFGYPDIEYGEYRAPKYIYYSQVKCPECGKPIYEYYDKSDEVLEALGVDLKNEIKQCENCEYCVDIGMGSNLICANCNSTFYNGLVRNDGLCEEWERKRNE